MSTPQIAQRRVHVSAYWLAVTIVSVALVGLIVYPLVTTVVRVFHAEGHWEFGVATDVFSAGWFSGAVRDTVTTVAAAGALATVVAVTMAWLNERTDANFGIIGETLPLLPLLLPPITLAVGWALLGLPDVGFLNVILRHLPLGLHINIESRLGLIWVYALYLVPFVYLVTSSAFHNIDPSLEEASRMSGAGLVRTIVRVAIPAVRPALIAALLLITIQGLSEYSIPRILAANAHVDILSVRIIQMLTATYPPETGSALGLSGMLFIVILVIWFLQRRAASQGNFATISGRGAGAGRLRLGVWKWPARALLIAYIGFASVLPMLAVLLVAVQPYWTPNPSLSRLTLDHFRWIGDNHLAQSALSNSLRLGAVGALVGICIAAPVAIYVGRRSGGWTRVVDATQKLPAAFSNIVLGVSFLFAFSGAPFNLSGTLTLLLLCYLVVHMPQASIAAGSAVSQVGGDLAEASSIAGAGEWRTVRRVMLPLMLPGLLAGWSLLFVMIAGELSASSLLAGIGTPVIGTVIVQIWDSGSWGQLAAFTTTFTALAFAVIVIMAGAGRFLQRHRRG